MQNYNYHCHTNAFGLFDGHHSLKEMLDAVESFGFKEIGISNHLICHPGIVQERGMFFLDPKKAIKIYNKNIEEIREEGAKRKIKVLAGFEVDFFSSAKWRKMFEKEFQNLEVDYFIGATHFLFDEKEERVHNIYYSLEDGTFDKEDLRGFLKFYWQNLANAAQSGYFNFLAHIDLPKKFGFCIGKEWDEHKHKLIEAIAKNKQPVEINTGGWDTCKEQFPADWMLKELQRKDVPIVISDDSHDVSEVGRYFKEAEALLNDLNYTNRWRL